MRVPSGHPRSHGIVVSCIALSVLFLWLVWPAMSGAYVRSTTGETLTPLYWSKSNCILVSLHQNGSDDLSNSSERDSVSRAINNWRQAVANCSFMSIVLEPEATSSMPGFEKSADDNANVIFWEEDNWPHDRMAAGITTVFFLEKKGHSQDGQILDADIELNGQFFTFTNSGQSGATDVENTVTHEMGHLMGLDHPCFDGARIPRPKDDEGNPIPDCSAVVSSNTPEYKAMRESTMYNFADPGETKKRTPEADDIQGICEIYPLEMDPGECRPVIYEEPNGGCCVVGGNPSTVSGLALLLALLLPWVLGRRLWP